MKRRADKLYFRTTVVLNILILAVVFFFPYNSKAVNGDISNISVLDITHASALISFDVGMDKPAYGFIEFGREVPYGYKTVDSLFDSVATPKHFERALTGLAPSTTYHFRIGVKEKDTGITYYSADNTVTTQAGEAVQEPELPRVYVDTTLPVQTGSTLSVDSACSNLQQKIDAAQPGDTIIIPAGAICSGTFNFPAKTGSGWVVIRTSTPDSQLPEGQRVSPSQSSLLATMKLNQTLTGAAININNSAHHYRFIGLEITTEKSASQSELDPKPYFALAKMSTSAHHIIFDRSYFHGQDFPDRLRYGILFFGADVAIINSYFDRMSYWQPLSGSVSQYNTEGTMTIKVSNPGGPGLLENNHIEGIGMPYFQEDYGSAITASDYVIRGNHFINPEKYRPGSSEWDGHNYKVRQIFELKRGARYLVEGNVFENYWADINQGFAFVITSSAAAGLNTDVSDLTVRDNIFKNGTNGITFGCFSYQEQKGTKIGRRYKISNNLFVGIDGWKYVSSLGIYPSGHRGNILRPFSGCEDLQFEHNTVYNNRGSGPRFLTLGGSWGSGLKYDNNILWMNNDGGAYGSSYDGSSAAGMTPTPQGRGTALLNGYWLRNPSPFWSFDNNVVVAGVTNSKDMTGNVDVAYARSLWPTTNFWPDVATPAEREAQVGFTSPSLMDFSLKAASPYKNKGTDGKDPGVDMVALNYATRGAVNGIWTSLQSPTISSFTASPSAIALGQSATLSWAVSGNPSPTLTIDNGVGNVTGLSSKSVSPATTTAYTLTATNSAGSATKSVTITVTLPSDTTPPTVSITSPLNGATVSGIITVSANASDNVGVAGVQFKLDGSNLGGEDTASPYSISWNTASTTNGSHTLTTIAKDAAGNQSTSTPATVTVSNTTTDTQPPTTPTNLTATAISSTQINLSWTASTDNVGVAGYKVYRAGTQIAAVTTGTSYQDTGLTPSTTYSYTVSAYDAAGNNSAQSSSTSATTALAPDTTAPIVLIISPTSGQTLSETVSITASSTDPVIANAVTSGVAGVQFKIDGANLGTEDTLSPYTASLDTTAYSNGSHSLTALARDNAGNIKTAESVTVTFSNTTPPPPTPTLSVTLSASSLTGNAPLSVNLTAIASTTATSTLTFTFYCNRPDSGVDITPGFDKQVTSTFAKTQTHLCVYGEAKTYTPKILVTSGSLVAEDRKAVTVSPPVITNPPVIFSFTAIPSSITAGQSATLSWTVSNATTLSIDQGIGQVTPSEGSVTVSPAVTTTYTLTAANAAGLVTQYATVSVSSAVYQIRLVNDQGTYYLIKNNQRLGITSPGILYSYGFDFKDALPATASDLSLPLGNILLPGDGYLVKSSQDPTVYLISQSQRYAFTSASVFSALGFSFNNVFLVTDPELQNLSQALNLDNPDLPHLPGVDIVDNGTVYWLAFDHTRQGYPSLPVYNSWHKDNDFSSVVPANSADRLLEEGEMVKLRVVE